MLRAGHEEEAMIGADYATQAEMNRCENHMPGIFTMLFPGAGYRHQVAANALQIRCAL
ncbi:hypothetical protein [Paraburkholderia phenazinium]|jgi:hypothetical protein|uniref:hypothetical protein n=1 Tax=Paraburkholderia phenazinium TaxID=60549 RepID=UPI00158DBACF|nr:hypothetical protein [Paraburkholderia phenazinium]